MDQQNLQVSLGPCFVAAFAVQQFLEILTSVLNLDANPTFEKYKKAILSISSFVLGLLLAGFLPAVRIFASLQVECAKGVFDILVTGLVLSAGTEGLNSVLKFMKYTKEDKKATAASKEPGAAAAGAAAGVPTAASLRQMNLK